MKRTISIITCIFLLVILCCVQYFTILKPENTFSLTNSNGKSIPAKIYSRIVESEIDNKKESVYQILIFFDERENNKFNPILLIPKYKMIGIVEGGKDEFIFFGNKVLQKSRTSNKFNLLTNSTFFDNAPPIFSIVFEEKKITFNSFEGLEKYGQSITLNYE
jgi:hypothetical protein